ncbi:hypothetical protein [Pseudarthrobacter sp. NIBRBAC000502771]|uniref:hypothetical protein n=1 Tax=Pseudarthrobacter sp. NIBRBAC000502771 TaxID=2590774 RepID=UPI0011310520|nr:hypothetical protein [Pseudarthrobacter sp. NIBRBAC000502771]QDG61226.1 hypothetical protein NIBR502771_02155 [Pseudarthrobacter sp. NIBRBAC000502771]
MTAKTMAEVLAEHEMENSPVIRGEGYTRCSCGFLSKGAYSRASHNRHVSDALSAAGFGLVADAKAEALEEAANDMDGLERLSSYPEESCNDEENAAVEAYDNATNSQEWLRARAAALRGDS